MPLQPSQARLWGQPGFSHGGSISRTKMPHKPALTQAPWAPMSSFHLRNSYLAAYSSPSSPGWLLPLLPPPSTMFSSRCDHQSTSGPESVSKETPFYSTHMHLAVILHPHTLNSSNFYNCFPYSPFHLLSTHPSHTWLHWQVINILISHQTLSGLSSINWEANNQSQWPSNTSATKNPLEKAKLPRWLQVLLL